MGRRNDAVCLQRKTLLKPFGITRYYTDSWSAYTRHLTAEEHSLGTRNTQHLERKHLTLRTRTTRLVRGLGQMTQDTYGKPYLHTFLAFLNS